MAAANELESDMRTCEARQGNAGDSSQSDMTRKLVRCEEQISEKIAGDLDVDRLVLVQVRRKELIVECPPVLAPLRSVVLKHKYPVQVCST